EVRADKLPRRLHDSGDGVPVDLEGCGDGRPDGVPDLLDLLAVGGPPAVETAGDERLERVEGMLNVVPDVLERTDDLLVELDHQGDDRADRAAEQRDENPVVLDPVHDVGQRIDDLLAVPDDRADEGDQGDADGDEWVDGHHQVQ